MASSYFGSETAQRPHLVEGKRGVAGEVADLRSDTNTALEAVERNGLVRVDEWVDPPASDDDHFLAAQATAAAAQTVLAKDLINATIATGPRGILITRSAAVGSYTTGVITIKGKAYGEDITLTFTPTDADGGDTIDSNEDLGMDEISSISFPAQVDAAGAFDVGFTDDLVLYRGIRDLAGVSTPIREVEAGSVVTTGTFSGRKYTQPVNTPDGSNDYAVVYVPDSDA